MFLLLCIYVFLFFVFSNCLLFNVFFFLCNVLFVIVFGRKLLYVCIKLISDDNFSWYGIFEGLFDFCICRIFFVDCNNEGLFVMGRIFIRVDIFILFN